MPDQSHGAMASGWKRLFEHFFLSYGSGSKLLSGFAKSKFWSWFSWVILVLGILGWTALFWAMSRANSE